MNKTRAMIHVEDIYYQYKYLTHFTCTIGRCNPNGTEHIIYTAFRVPFLVASIIWHLCLSVHMRPTLDCAHYVCKEYKVPF
jgi:hypothetical protein